MSKNKNYRLDENNKELCRALAKIGRVPINSNGGIAFFKWRKYLEDGKKAGGFKKFISKMIGDRDPYLCFWDTTDTLKDSYGESSLANVVQRIIECKVDAVIGINYYNANGKVKLFFLDVTETCQQSIANFLRNPAICTLD